MSSFVVLLAAFIIMVGVHGVPVEDGASTDKVNTAGLAQGEECKCVPYYLCNEKVTDTMVEQDDAHSPASELKNPLCERIIDVCCKNSNIAQSESGIIDI